ncbi:SPASM domain-containing protein [Palaeococcus ferrophilus]|uniref:SPASM domain-containing protein n=1 Tax=Palaeococcus ferrophilus TaxID=83868 RepID=UPI00064F6A4F|nr:SPASM domain-containing protein [Palaeococcus ferrophilus]
MAEVKVEMLTIEREKGSSVRSVGKPPWTEKTHDGKLERLILQLGAGKGEFSEITGIPRSIGCMGNNRFILRREKLSTDRKKQLIREFQLKGGRELYLTNYDEVEELIELAEYAGRLGIDEVYAVVRIEDAEKMHPIEGVRIVVEMRNSPENWEKLNSLGFADGVLLMVEADEYPLEDVPFPGDVYVDVIHPPSMRGVNFNILNLRRIDSGSTQRYHPCMGGTLAITADGYALPCPLLRNFVVGDAKKEGISKLARKTRLKNMWKITKDRIEPCSACPFKYVCHDCRALEFQASGDPYGVEYCPLEP